MTNASKHRLIAQFMDEHDKNEREASEMADSVISDVILLVAKVSRKGRDPDKTTDSIVKELLK